MVNANNFWMWLIVGMMPYYAKQHSVANGKRLLEVRALFWSIAIWSQQKGDTSWKVRIGLIQKISCFIWEALIRLREDDSDKG